MIKFEAVQTPDGYEVKININGTWYTIADCYHVPTIGDAKQNAKRIAKLLNQFFNHKQKEEHDTT